MEKRNLEDLCWKDDEIGDQFEINCTIDTNTRDDCFVYIDGRLYYSREHFEAINEYLEEIDPNGEEGLQERPTQEYLQKMNVPVSLGNIVDGNVFIEETMTFNCNLSDVINELKKSGYNKIYTYDYMNDIIERVGSRKTKIYDLR